MVYPEESDEFKNTLSRLNVDITQQLFWLIEEFKSGFSHNFNTFTNEIFNECFVEEQTPEESYNDPPKVAYKDTKESLVF